jgi:acetyl esterase
MPLDLQAKALLDQIAANPGPPLADFTPVQARGVYEAFVGLVGAQGVPIGRTEDRTIPGPVGEIAVRIYTPIAAGGTALPALVFFHGGGFVFGSLNTHDALCRQLANEAGVRIISVDYRLAPENKFPAAVEDAFASVQWVEANAMELDIDPNRIAVGGDSAGANLAAVSCFMARDAGTPHLVHQMLLYPQLDFPFATPSHEEFREGYFLDRARLEWFAAHYTQSTEEFRDYRVSPLRAPAFHGLPSTLVVTAGHDPLRDEGRIYAEKLAEAGVPVVYRNYPGQIHGFMNMTGVIDEGRAAIKAAAADLKTALEA